jgi:hypothetical protein
LLKNNLYKLKSFIIIYKYKMEYIPPTETLPIFDSTVFENRNTSLTFDEASKYFLEFPRAQGPETLQETTIIGALTCSSTASFGTVGSATNIPICIADYSTILPADSSTKIPTTAWVQTAITGGGGATIGQYAVPPLYLACGDSAFSVNTNHPLVFPANARTATISLFGGGGQAGNLFYDGTSYFAGGQGGAGAYASITFDIGPNANTISGNPTPLITYSCTNIQPSGLTGGNIVSLTWWPAGSQQYNPSIQSSIGTSSIATVFCGNDGTNASSGGVGTSGTGGVVSAPSGNSYAKFNLVNGAPAPTPPAPFPPSTAIVVQGGQNVGADLRTTLTSSWCKGETTTFVGDGSFTQITGSGGILLEFFT